MAKGYPERARELDVDHPVLDDVLAPDTCRICKHRPATKPHTLCDTCYAALHPQAERGAARAS